MSTKTRLPKGLVWFYVAIILTFLSNYLIITGKEMGKFFPIFSHRFYNSSWHNYLHTQKDLLSSRESTGGREQERVSLSEITTIIPY